MRRLLRNLSLIFFLISLPATVFDVETMADIVLLMWKIDVISICLRVILWLEKYTKQN